MKGRLRPYFGYFGGSYPSDICSSKMQETQKAYKKSSNAVLQEELTFFKNFM